VSDEDLKSKVKVGFSDEIEHSALYKWCIFEDRGKDKSDEFIPFVWGIKFKANNIKYANVLTNSFDDNRKVSQRDIINADLIALPQAGDVNFSFFGSNTPITDITLEVHKIPPKEKTQKEQCDIHVFDEIEDEDVYTLANTIRPSCMIFTVRLFEENYSKLLNQIHNNQISSLSFSVSKVRGFYSGWTPTIGVETLHGVKILKTLTDVEFPKNVKAATKNSIPTISQTYETSDIEFSLTANISKEFLMTKDDDINNDYDDDYYDSLTDNENNKDIHSVQMLEILKEIKKIKVVLGVIAVIIVCYILT